MRPRDGMLLDDIDLTQFDAGFFEILGTEVIATGPNQRQTLEVVVEGLQDAGIAFIRPSGAPMACLSRVLVRKEEAESSAMVDYGDM
ncbi:hypothetical protein AAE478_010277 [Parahypoxylon ruwenzoriense]